jgi:hypothetical protein
MVGEDLDPRPDDEHHKQEVQEVRHVHPDGQTGVRPSACGDHRPGIVRDEPGHSGDVPQSLPGGHRHDEQDEPERKEP